MWILLSKARPEPETEYHISAYLYTEEEALDDLVWLLNTFGDARDYVLLRKIG